MKKSFFVFVVFLLVILFSPQRVFANYQCEAGSPGAETCFTTQFTCSMDANNYACYSATDPTCPSGCNPYNICDTIQGRVCGDPGYHGAGFMWYCCPDPTPTPTPTPVPCNYDCSAWNSGTCGGTLPNSTVCTSDKKNQYNTCTSSVSGCNTYYINQVCAYDASCVVTPTPTSTPTPIPDTTFPVKAIP